MLGKMMHSEDDLASLKEEILNEIMEKLDMDEGMKLKPKVAAVSVETVDPMEKKMPDGNADEKEGDDDEDDDLRMLLRERMKA